MHTDPKQNDPNDPLVSIFITNYEVRHFRLCLENIFDQDILKNFEIILIDDATSDGSWETALEYLEKYPRRITIQRNRKVLGPLANFHKCLRMAKGRYCTRLSGDQAFLPEYVNSSIKTMISDPFAKFHHVFRTEDPGVLIPLQSSPPLPSVSEKPLVSILCYNYNYGRYLRQCLESVFAQTYENIELCFSDNASTDESWTIALEFIQKYPGKMHVTRNRQNFGPDANFANTRRNMQGKYFVNFCSDDVLAPEYVERCVEALEKNPNTGFALVNRAVIDENGRRSEEPPFYNQSCVIPGEEQAAVYMMAGINPSVSQIMYRNNIVDSRTATGALVARYYGTRILDFNVAIDFDVAYLKEPLLLHRVHSKSDTNQADASLLPVLGLYVLNHQFADLASVRNLTKVTGRLPQSLEKLARLGTRYSVRSLLANDESVGLRYYHLAMAIDPEVANDPTWKKLNEYWAADPAGKAEVIEYFKGADNLATRTISYDPPPGSIPISNNGKQLGL